MTRADNSTDSYDVFLSYNSQDHQIVEDIARRLRLENLRPFIDRWFLVRGQRWRPALEQTLATCRSVAVCIGPGGMGSWQQREVDAALDRQGKDDAFPVIPVLLPGCEPPLGFLKQITWIDLRQQPLDQGILVLRKSIFGEPIGGDLQAQFAETRSTVCPYRGLLAFREEDAPFFFGREAAIDQLVQAVARDSFLAVVGASGSGKSSVVRAGLVPRLRRQREEAWEIVSLVPGEHPMKALAAALMPLLEPDLREVDRLVEVGKLAGALVRQELSLADTIRRILEKQSGTDRLLLIADQWEELYTLTTDDGERRRFLDELLDAARSGPLTIVATLRGDFVGHALKYRPLSDRLQNAQINLGPMTQDELGRAVREPVALVGLEFEEGLDHRILGDVGDEPGNLPLLEFVLRRLWEERHHGKLQHGEYDKMGGLKGAVAAKADQLYDRLSAPEQDALQRIFLDVVRTEPSGGYTRRRERIENIPASSRDLVHKLADERLLVTSRLSANESETFEVAHEALIHGWTRLNGWLNADREFLLWRERLQALLEVWQRAGSTDYDLPRGPTLDEAERWLERRTDRLSKTEREFVERSRAARQQRREQEAQRQQQELRAKEDLLRLETEKREQAEIARVRGRRITYLSIAFGLVAIALALWASSKQRVAERSVNALKIASDRLNESRGRAENLVREASRSDFANAQARLTDGKWQEAIAYLGRSLRYDPKNLNAHDALWCALRYGRRDSGSVPLLSLPHRGTVISASFSPDGTRVATAGSDGTAQIWDAATGQLVGVPLQHEGPVTSATFSLDGTRVVTASADNSARIWHATTGRPIGSPLQHQRTVTTASFSPDGTRVVTSSADNTARIWDAATGRPIGSPLQHEGTVTSACFSPDGARLVTCSADNTARIWDSATGQLLGAPLQHDYTVTSASFSPDGTRLITTNLDHSARIWEAATGRPIGSPLQHQRTVTTASFSPDGSRIVTASADTARIWYAISGQSIGVPLQHKEKINSARFSPDGTRVVTSSSDRTARIWDAGTGQLLGPPLQHQYTVTTAIFNPDGSRVITASQDDTARIWRAATGYPVGSPLPHKDKLHHATFSLDGTRVLTAGYDKTARIWDAATGQLVGPPLQHQRAVVPAAYNPAGIRGVNTAAFSPDGTRVITTASMDDTVRIWDAATGQPVGSPLQHKDKINSATFSPDGARVLTASFDQTARIWDAATGEPVGPLLQHQRTLTSAIFSPDGSRVVTTSDDNTARIWNAATGKEVGSPLQHQSTVNSAAFSGDGTRLVTASADKTARVWDAATGQPIGPPLQHQRNTVSKFSLFGPHGVNSATFSPDGTRVVTSSDDNTARIWDAVTGQPLGPPLQHQDAVNSARFSPDGVRVVTASDDRTARIWDTATGQPIGSPLQHQDKVNSARFSPDGRHVVTASFDHTVRIWDVAAPEAKAAAAEQLAMYCAGMKLDPQLGTFQAVTDAERSALGEQYQSVLAHLPDWFLVGKTAPASSSSLPLSSRSPLTIRGAATRLIRTGNEACIREAQTIDPGHPLIQLALAASEKNPSQAEFLREYGLGHLNDEGELCRLAAEVLLAQKDKGRATRALEKATRIDANHPDLRALRARLEAL